MTIGLHCICMPLFPGTSKLLSFVRSFPSKFRAAYDYDPRDERRVDG